VLELELVYGLGIGLGCRDSFRVRVSVGVPGIYSLTYCRC